MSRDPLAHLRDPGTIRARCAAVTQAVERGRSGWFTLDRSRLSEAARRVAALTRSRFPDLKIPYHSRWRHFEAGGVDRKAELDTRLAGCTDGQVARAQIDLTVVSVLLDAGAGASWRYREGAGAIDALALPVHRQQGDELLAMLGQASGASGPDRADGPDGPDGAGGTGGTGATGQAGVTPETRATSAAGEAGGFVEAPAAPADKAPAAAAPGATYARSEGLAVASFRAFLAGVFSDVPGEPLRVDARALKRLDAAALRAVFQVGPSNPLVGLEGRAALLVRLGEVLEELAAVQGGEARPGRLYDTLLAASAGGALGEAQGEPQAVVQGRGVGSSPSPVPAQAILGALLRDYAPIWLGGSRVLGLPAGDVWPHPWAGSAGPVAGASDPATVGWVPFHKLSQWLTYSLLEPLEWAGVPVVGLEALTGLPEYRNGGLLLDTGVVVPRAAGDLARTWKPSDEFIVEWRALTVTLLDELAVLVREALGPQATDLPLACILEGGTWAAGREIAQELRGGAPPLVIDSDGTVF
ncbi:MAG: hypothetical protein RI988_3854 [Pseudomonadota bacterium]|jgi:hypothetical protein